MNTERCTHISIFPERGEVIVEQVDTDGVIQRKNIEPSNLRSCIANSQLGGSIRTSGLLPSKCIATVMSDTAQYFFLDCPTTCLDFTYANTEYSNFPIPRMIFGIQYLLREQKPVKCGICVVGEGKLTVHTPLYHFPFSNVHEDGQICLGSNSISAYKKPEQLENLANYILTLPNNNDEYCPHHNKLQLEYRDLLEHMKDKSPADYYRDILVESGKTLGQFLEWR